MSLHLRVASLLSVLFLVSASYALQLDIEPKYVSTTPNSTVIFTISIVGDGKLYDLKAYGPFLSWSEKKVWVGPYGKKITLEMDAKALGKYTITVEADGVKKTATVEVFSDKSKVSGREDLLKRIKELEKEYGNTTEIQELYRLYNEGNYPLLEIKIKELENSPVVEKKEEFNIGSTLPKAVLLIVLLAAAFATLRYLFP